MLPCLRALSIHDACPTEMPKRDRAEAELDGEEPRSKPVHYGDGLWGLELSPEEEEEEERDVQLLVLDFDGTLTTNTFQPRANSVGITARLPAASGNVELFAGLTKEEHYSLYGGREVVEKMRKLFSKLRKVGVQMRILSYGKKEAIVKSLETVRLIKYFTSETDGAVPGDLVYGVDVPPLNEGEEMNKWVVVQEWMETYKLEADQVVFVDDDPSNIDEPEKGEENYGVAQALDPGYAKLHTGPNFLASEEYIRGLCGLG